jgi:uncharacterized membrane protein YphA (DoxX/SURF4 family)
MNDSSIFHNPRTAPLLIQLVIALEWLEGGFEKLRSGTFVSTLPKILERFSQGNPHAWYVDSFLKAAIEHPTLFGQLVQWGEAFTGIGLIIGVLLALFKTSITYERRSAWVSGVALLGGVWLNAHFYFAAGWTSPSTGGLNLLMFGIELILLFSWGEFAYRTKKKT